MVTGIRQVGEAVGRWGGEAEVFAPLQAQDHVGHPDPEGVVAVVLDALDAAAANWILMRSSWVTQISCSAASTGGLSRFVAGGVEHQVRRFVGGEDRATP